ncbi:MAG: hypothetical protein V1887_01135 [Candidatus Aenigmatarchaeota archaeon]
MRAPKTFSKWTQDEVEILKRTHKSRNCAELVKLLPKHSMHGIYTKAYGLGLTKIDTVCRILSDFEKGWLCGLIDGEGTLTLHMIRTEKSVGYHPRLMIGNTNKELVYKIASVVGSGHISFNKRQGKYKPMWMYELSSRPLLKLLPQIAGSLVVKREQAIVVQRVLEINKDHYGGRRTLLSAEAKAELNDLVKV